MSGHCAERGPATPWSRSQDTSPIVAETPTIKKEPAEKENECEETPERSLHRSPWNSAPEFPHRIEENLNSKDPYATNPDCCMPQNNDYNAGNRSQDPATGSFNTFTYAGQSYSGNQSCKDSSYQQLSMPQDQQKNQNFYNRFMENSNRDYSYQSDLFGRHCSYVSLLNSHSVESNEESNRQRYDKDISCHYNSARDPSDNTFHQPPLFPKNSYSEYQTLVSDVNLNREREDERRSESLNKIGSSRDNALMVSTSSARNEMVYGNHTANHESPKQEQLNRSNTLASPGNSCIVSSTDTGRHYSEDAPIQKSGWVDKAGTNSSRQDVVVSSSTRCDSSAQPRPDLVSTTATTTARRGSLQLWQFLVALLDEPAVAAGCIAWTGRGLEFKLLEPEEVARRWGMQKNRPAMNYDKLSRSLRYYYEKGIMQKVAGERYVYKFVCDPDALFNMAYGPHHPTTEVLSSLHATKSQAQNAKTSPDNPEDLCLKSSQYPQNQLSPIDVSKAPAPQAYGHQNYDVFSSLYNGAHHLNYHGAHLSLQQYLGVGAHSSHPASGVHLTLEQQSQQHEYHQQGHNGSNWNVARYYHQNQVNYDT